MSSRAVRTRPLFRSARSAFLGVMGVLLLALLWEILGRMEAVGPALPPVTRIIMKLDEPQSRELLLRALSVTSYEAGVGYVIGVTAALLFATLTVFFRRLRPGIMHFGVLIQAVPAIAIAPVLSAVVSRDVTPFVLAAMTVYFTTLVATTTGFSAARPAHEDLLTVLGANPRDRFLRLQLPSGLPLIADGLKLAAPAAILGAILGEWFGTERGLGPILVSTMQNFQMDLLWATAMVALIVSVAVYGVLSLVSYAVSNRYG